MTTPPPHAARRPRDWNDVYRPVPDSDEPGAMLDDLCLIADARARRIGRPPTSARVIVITDESTAVLETAPSATR